ncbi:Cro/CI family transcriptional regulator [Aeromonas rivipollensis]|uniref:Cro/CI family transcriptional regulator n=1 Tax=Aeromonas rivipollensis TaxID=948519 RepID=UPI00259F2821|nr:Cro/CI family transcriptional regulator [Aeromonas rivipollensis]MDM5057627.1 Cro/CI family transcriptional regulator [Aeromonas rivipollensis]
MKKNDVLEYFGGVSKAANALGITRSAVSQWDEIIPESSAYKIESLTGGQLKANPAAPSARPAQ